MGKKSRKEYTEPVWVGSDIDWDNPKEEVNPLEILEDGKDTPIEAFDKDTRYVHLVDVDTYKR